MGSAIEARTYVRTYIHGGCTHKEWHHCSCIHHTTPLNLLTDVGCLVLVEHPHNNLIIATVPALTLKTVVQTDRQTDMSVFTDKHTTLYRDTNTPHSTET